MHELLPFVSISIADTVNSMEYFLPEIFLGILFVTVLLTDLLFGRLLSNITRLVASVGLLFVLIKDYQQVDLLNAAGAINGTIIFNGMLLLNRTAISLKIIIDFLACMLLVYFMWDNKLNSHKKKLADLYSISVGCI